MNFTPKYNALGLKNYLDNNPTSKLDFIDAILLNEIHSLIENWQNINTIEINNETYYNISYDKLRSQLPHLNYGIKKNNQKVKRPNSGIAERLTTGLLKEKLISKHINKEAGNIVYFKLTPIGNKLATYRKQTDNPIGNKPTTLSETKQHNKYINNKNIKYKREGSHFDFLNSNNKEIKEIKNKYKLTSEQWSLCIEKFKLKPKNNGTIESFKSFVISWVANTNSTQREQQQQPIENGWGHLPLK
ncbi:hypothetical protein DFR65_101368 [Oceanihabitans sediminis]|uniref:Uncharacterized protein n=1 Tax=Oceanihabitans sediminis TaxID=1812012 RepID=A0A368P8A3_9FLAO|nr:hypothetical protein [Oceanihabitans sediminis]RBP34475.1 hypothetical protein DFR65_101368 [Oceanihabitans sediminis]RCU58145.1 hypothetical protein DU428_01820 [Oceanihabitans sediminis]